MTVDVSCRTSSVDNFSSIDIEHEFYKLPEEISMFVVIKAQPCIEIPPLTSSDFDDYAPSWGTTPPKLPFVRLDKLPGDMLNRIMQYKFISIHDLIRLSKTNKIFKKIIAVNQIYNFLIVQSNNHFMFGLDLRFFSKSNVFDRLRFSMIPIANAVQVCSDEAVKFNYLTTRSIVDAFTPQFSENAMFRAETAYLNLVLDDVQILNLVWQNQWVNDAFEACNQEIIGIANPDRVDLKFVYHTCSKSRRMVWDFNTFDRASTAIQKEQTIIHAVHQHGPLSFGRLYALECRLRKQIIFNTNSLLESDTASGSYGYILKSEDSELVAGLALTVALTESFAESYLSPGEPEFETCVNFQMMHLEMRTNKDHPDIFSKTCPFSQSLCTVNEANFDGIDWNSDLLTLEQYMDAVNCSVVWVHDGSRILPVLMTKTDLSAIHTAFREHMMSNNTTLKELKQNGINAIIDLVLKPPFVISMRVHSSNPEFGNNIRSFTMFIADTVYVREVVNKHSKCFENITGKDLKVFGTNCCVRPDIHFNSNYHQTETDESDMDSHDGSQELA